MSTLTKPLAALVSVATALIFSLMGASSASAVQPLTVTEDGSGALSLTWDLEIPDASRNGTDPDAGNYYNNAQTISVRFSGLAASPSALNNFFQATESGLSLEVDSPYLVGLGFPHPLQTTFNGLYDPSGNTFELQFRIPGSGFAEAGAHMTVALPAAWTSDFYGSTVTVAVVSFSSVDLESTTSVEIVDPSIVVVPPAPEPEEETVTAETTGLADTGARDIALYGAVAAALILSAVTLQAVRRKSRSL